MEKKISIMLIPFVINFCPICVNLLNKLPQFSIYFFCFFASTVWVLYSIRSLRPTEPSQIASLEKKKMGKHAKTGKLQWEPGFSNYNICFYVSIYFLFSWETGKRKHQREFGKLVPILVGTLDACSGLRIKRSEGPWNIMVVNCEKAHALTNLGSY